MDFRKKLTEFAQQKLGSNLLMLVGAGFLICSFFLPYWQMTLNAPQYPRGLRLSIYLNGVEGDTREINILNHYIGMDKIENAAKFEREIALLAILGLSLGAVLVLPIFGFRVNKFMYLPPILFLIGFIGDMYYWMYQFGHKLNPEAAVRISPFTPAVVGFGKIGQFETTAFFSWGFFLALAATLIFVFALMKREKYLAKTEKK
jgi:copper chaperone NosL